MSSCEEVHAAHHSDIINSGIINSGIARRTDCMLPPYPEIRVLLRDWIFALLSTAGNKRKTVPTGLRLKH